MRILDRAIIFRFLTNFALLFALLYLCAVGVDTILHMDQNLLATQDGVRRGLYSNRVMGFLIRMLEFYGPRVFQVYQLMAGLLCVGAMGFTFVQMHRSRELVAIMAAGVPLRRCVWAVLGAALVLNGLQVVNQELILPRLAHRLIGTHSSVADKDTSVFTVPLTRDRDGNLFYAGKLHPGEGRIEGFLALQRDAQGRLIQRVTAERAHWDAASGSWLLVEGRAMPRNPDGLGQTVAAHAQPLDRYVTDLSPVVLTARNYRVFAGLLSSSQLDEIAAAGAMDWGLVRRMQLGRLGGVLVNLLVLMIAVPFFLQRGPANMLRQSVLCAAVCVPAIIGGAILMAAPVEGLPPTVMVALPVALLLPAAAARLSWMPS